MLGSVAWSLPEYSIDLATQVYEQSNNNTKMMLAESIASNLYEDNPASAWAWYDQLTNEVSKQVVFGSLIMQVAQEDPQQALSLAHTQFSQNSNRSNSILSTQGIYDNSLLNVLEMVFYSHPQMAEDWLAAASINETLRAELQGHLDIIKERHLQYPKIGRYGFTPGLTTSNYDIVETLPTR